MAQLQSTSITGSLIVTGGITGSISGSIVSPGSTTQVLYNNGGVVAGSSGFVYSGRNVGIGTTSPKSLLHVGSATNFSIDGRISAVYGAASETIFTVGVSGVDYPQLLNFGVDQTGLYSTISARQFTVATENKLVLQPNGGNVGIGTISPGYKLHVNGNSYFADTMYNGGGYISWTSGYSDGTTQTYNGHSLAFLTNSSYYIHFILFNLLYSFLSYSKKLKIE